MRSADTISRRSALADHGVDQGGVRFETEASDEAGRPQHSQRIVTEADLRSERRAQDTLGRGRPPPEGIDEHRVARPGGVARDGRGRWR